MPNENKLPPVSIIIFGATSDLAWRKLIPALYNLYLDHQLPENFAIFGMNRREIELEDWHAHMQDGINQFSRRGKIIPSEWDDFAAHLSLCAAGDFDDHTAYGAMA